MQNRGLHIVDVDRVGRHVPGKVVGGAIDKARLDAVAAAIGSGVAVMPADLTAPAEVDRLVEGLHRVRRTFGNWRQIGQLVFDNAVASYNGDAVVHFTHPTWREDRNDPATATRSDGIKVG